MFRGMDLSSWQGILTSIFGIVLITLLGMGVRLIMMMTIQQRRERMNRQINERLRTLIAAYKTLGGSFTGNLSVDPTHLRDIRRRQREGRADIAAAAVITATDAEAPQLPPIDLAMPAAADGNGDSGGEEGSDRTRRIRDAVEAALSDIILLGTEEQVRLAAKAATELVAGTPVHTHELVVSLRDFIRDALDLDPIAADIALPMQGPTRPSSGGGKGGNDGGRNGGAGGGRGGGGGGGMGGGGMAIGMGMGGAGVGLGLGHDSGSSEQG